MASSWYDATYVLICTNQQKTTLTAFFETCATIEAACQYTYQELYFIDPFASECFYLRLLLTVVHDLLEDNNEWIYCLEKTAANICDDLHPFLYNKYGILDPTEDQIYNFGLFLLDEILHDSNKSLNIGNILIYEQLNWNYDKLQEIVNEFVIQLNHEQCIAYQDILNSVNEQSDTIVKIKYVKENLIEKSNIISVWAIGTYPIGQGDHKIELTLFISTNYKERDFDSQAIFEQDEFYSVRRKIIPGKYKDSVRPKLKILDKVLLLNKCPLKVSLISIPQEIPAELNDDENSVFGILVNDYAIREHNFIVKIFNGNFDNDFYMYAKEINNMSNVTKNIIKDRNQTLLTSPKSI
ncbi:16499_t:CDS:2 [Cetraspora pellucida]|uniref:16499_t:CDS:1 n=1 Tax=Cetraspora pellucida TaxID=1433469 RepID=A0ACA9K241_9GLOM|nr:16499_t:CDS:2 [Cetraspora pellucida]